MVRASPSEVCSISRPPLEIEHAPLRPAPPRPPPGQRRLPPGGPNGYSQARLYQLLAARGGIEPAGDPPDPEYQCFAAAAKRYDEAVESVLPSKGRTIAFLHAAYHHGMAQCLLLDRIRPGWKAEIAGEGTTLFGLVEKTAPLDDAGAAAVLTTAKERFAWDGILAEQSALMEERLAEIRAFLESPGRRYRIHHGVLRGRVRK